MNIAVSQNDNDACTNDYCVPTTGYHHDPWPIDDNNACTIDGCDPNGIVNGVYHIPVTINDNDECTVDACDPVTGISHTATNVDDNNVCTTDACDPITGDVTHNAISIDDSNVCTTDACDPVSGVYHTTINVNDNNVCTTDGCDPLTGVYHNAINPNDTNVCTVDGCDPVSGVYHNAVSVNDNNVCTTDGCDPVSGVYHNPINVNDNNLCTIDGCDPVTGVYHNAVNCNDNNACTTDACDPLTGCIYTLVNTNDNNLCTDDGCDPVTGVYHNVVSCNDFDPCTVDGCNPTTGCTHTPTLEICGNGIDDNCNGLVDEGCVCIPPDAVGAILGNLVQCVAYAPGGAVYHITSVANATAYNWTVPSGLTIIAGQGTTAITVSWTGNAAHNGIYGQVCVIASNACGSNQGCATIDIQVSKPVQPNSISGLTKVCPGNMVTYSVAAVTRATSYIWTLPVGMNIVSGTSTNVIDVSVVAGFVGGTITVSAFNACGTSPARTRVINLNTPSVAGAITGLTTGVCNSNGVMYSIASIANADNYLWSVTAGGAIVGLNTGASIMVNWGNFTSATVSVVSVNGCGNSLPRSITVTGAPGQPGVITGSTTVCTLATYHYSIATVPGTVTYSWTKPTGTSIVGQGTKEVDITFSNVPATNQVISVKATNACGTSPVKTLSGIMITNCPRLEEALQEQNIMVYPNPVVNTLTIDFTSSEAGNYSEEITDLTGRVVQGENRRVVKGFNHQTIDVSKMANGVYLLIVKGRDKTSTFKLTVE